MLVLVAGKQSGTLYHMHGKEVDEIFSFVTERPEYSDNEAIFQAAPNNRVMSGSIEGYQDEDLIRDFIHELEGKIKEVESDFDELALLAPGSSRNKIKESLPKEWQKKITKTVEGNYSNQSPVEIMEILSKGEEEEFEPITNEEKKIMSIPEQ
jgi:hypothetical protein